MATHADRRLLLRALSGIVPAGMLGIAPRDASARRRRQCERCVSVMADAETDWCALRAMGIHASDASPNRPSAGSMRSIRRVRGRAAQSSSVSPTRFRSVWRRLGLTTRCTSCAASNRRHDHVVLNEPRTMRATTLSTAVRALSYVQARREHKSALRVVLTLPPPYGILTLFVKRRPARLHRLALIHATASGITLGGVGKRDDYESKVELLLHPLRHRYRCGHGRSAPYPRRS
jgi:hypothetical protein